MAGIRAMGAKLAYQGSSAYDKKVAHLTSLGAINTVNEEIDVTDHDSPNGNSEFIAGKKNHDNLSFAGNIVKEDTTLEDLWKLAQSREVKKFEATYADGSKMQFEGYIASIAIGEQTTDGLMGYEGELRITGEVTFTPNPGV